MLAVRPLGVLCAHIPQPQLQGTLLPCKQCQLAQPKSIDNLSAPYFAVSGIPSLRQTSDVSCELAIIRLHAGLLQLLMLVLPVTSFLSEVQLVPWFCVK